MFDTILGLPLHPLVVHAVVVLAPLTALMLLLFAVSERFRAWSGWLTTAVGALTTVLAFVATNSGEALERRVGESPLVEEHAEKGDVLPWVVLAATVVAAVLWWVWRSGRTAAAAEPGTHRSSALVRVLGIVGVLAAVALIVDVAIVGHSGATAVWKGVASQSAPQGAGDGDDG